MKHIRAAAKSRYRSQLHSSAKRNIKFDLTFEEWDSWWLSHEIDKNYPHNNLCMCRYNDAGSYNLDNIYMDSRGSNIKYSHNISGHPKGSSRSINTPIGIFDSITSAAQAVGVATTTMHQRVRENKPGYYYL